MSAVKYASMQSLKDVVSFQIDKSDINQALHLIYDFVERIVTEPLCTSQVFGSKTLDDLCQRIGEISFSKIEPEFTEATLNQQNSPVFVYIVTKIQKSGGHTRVIEDFIKAQPRGLHLILSTELTGKSDTGYLMKWLASQVNVAFEQAPKDSFEQKLTWLQTRLIEIRPNKIYLFNHHQDSVAVAAIQPEMRFNASFYHHGDHHLCLGVYLSHLEHIDPHPMGYHNCRDELGIANIYVPLTVDDKGSRPADWSFFQNKALTTCTAARSNKIEIPYYVSYLDLIPQLLKATGGRHVHIGRLTPWALFKIRYGLKRHGIRSDRFIYTPWVPSVWKSLHDYRVDLYVASFPYGGGLTLIEAMGAGIPVALHEHMFSRVLSGIDLAYPEVFSWRSPEDLLNYCCSRTTVDLEAASRAGRMQYEQFHSPEHLHRALNDSVEDRVRPNELSDKFSADSDEWALWMTRQLSIRRIISKAIYRVARRLRAWR